MTGKRRAFWVKVLLVPVYTLGLCIVMYFAGLPKDRWDKIASWVDKKFPGSERNSPDIAQNKP